MAIKILSNDPHAVYNREIRHWYVSHEICTKCHSDDVCRQNKSLCLKCMMEARDRGREYYKNKMSTEQRYNQYIHNKRRTDLMVAFGVCRHCQKRDVLPGHTHCGICLQKKRERAERERQAKGAVPIGFYSPTICSHCKKTKPNDGRKLCSECYDKALSALEIANSRCDRKNHYWNTDNKTAFLKV